MFAAEATDAGAVAVDVAGAVTVEHCQEMETFAATAAVEARMQLTAGLAQIVLEDIHFSFENSVVVESSTALSGHRWC